MHLSSKDARARRSRHVPVPAPRLAAARASPPCTRCSGGGRAGFVLRADRREKTRQGRWRPRVRGGSARRSPGLSALPGPDTHRQRGAAPEEERPREEQQQAGQEGRRQPERSVLFSWALDLLTSRKKNRHNRSLTASEVGGCTRVPSVHALFRRRQGGVCFESGPEREDSTRKMATAGEERLRRRSDPERSSSRPGRRDGDSRREFFVSPALVPKSVDVSSGPSGKHKLLFDDRVQRDETLLFDDRVQRDETGVLSDSENEEPIGRRIRIVSAFVRKTKTSSAMAGGAQRSRSCTDPVEDGEGKLKVTAQPAMMDRVGISHSYTAGILLSSENSRSASAPIAAADRRLAWRAVLTSSSTPLVLAPPRPERSISPESNDSISEELNHFKPIVCSPCTPPKRLPDGRLMEPSIVKSTPRNLTRGLQKSTSYEASPAVLQKWRQIELDRQNLKVNSKATLTSPVAEVHNKISGGEDGAAAKTHPSAAGDGPTSVNKRRLLFDPPAGDTDAFHKQSVKIRVPAIRYSGEATVRGSSESTIQQERQDRALALKLQRQFDLENQSVNRRRSPDQYFLRSWMSNQNRRRRGLRRSRRINKKH
ncbi:putative E3 ubiquitin-protein ligase RNF169 [Scophthalmus maximus]|uniref:RING-type E3 ubiquitin transferase n=1 Tax=Scophthalmus maximus TaxID=52904 RepID=A0A2U9B6I9_SCOMX|nr:putative E3 ubiquitin-protein ligase RNF169 [Scophthalmus maximus]